ncbi:MAG: FtsW/RodA/SpoVE family cell cycle protein, partial [Planctomycetes bacterium]|nr:FtsW/RodA/SpoVE family cell cycle protein [Planctomycetota bacterium]
MSATTGSLTSKLDHRSWLAWLARDGERDLARNLVLLSVFLLVSIGTVMVFSAAAFHWAIRDDTFYFLRKQLAWVAIAGLGGLFFYQIDYRLLRRCYWQLLVLSTILLFAVLIPQLGTDVNQARRWIRLGGGLQFQPSELAKLSVIVFVAAFLANDPERRRRFLGGFLVVCFAISPLVLLILFEPDLGTSLFVLGIAVMLLIVGGMRLSYMLVVGVVFAPIVGYAAHLRWEEIRDRVMGFLDPDSVYQVKHSLTALGA